MRVKKMSIMNLVIINKILIRPSTTYGGGERPSIPYRSVHQWKLR